MPSPRKILQCTLRMLCHALLISPLIVAAVSDNALSADAIGQLSSQKEKEQMVEQAVVLYEAGNRSAAKERFEQLAPVFSENSAVPYFLGLIALEEGDRSGAIFNWQRYVSLDPHSENAMKIRKYLTLLLREQAAENARRVVTQEATLMKTPVAQITVAVPPFENVGYMILGPLGKGIAALLISDLSKVQGLAVVDRIQLQALLQEMPVGTPTTPKVGRLLQVSHVVTGSLKDSETGSLQIVSSILDTMKKKAVSAQQAGGNLNQFYDIEKEIACEIVKGLGKRCDDMPADFHRVHTQDISALVAYSWGLDHFDQGKFDQAREMFHKALEKDPEFALAQEALLATPTSDIAGMATSEIVSDVSSNHRFATAAVSTSDKDSGFSKTALIGGGIAIAGGAALALAGGGGGGGGDPGPSPTTSDPSPSPAPPAPGQLDLSGSWQGNLATTRGSDVAFTMDITQNSDWTITGHINFSQWECMSGQGSVQGEIETTNPVCSYTLTIRSTSLSFELNGLCSEDDLEPAGLVLLNASTQACEVDMNDRRLDSLHKN